MEEKIKCHLCGGKAMLKSEDLRLDNDRITIKDFPHYKCGKCKEQFATSSQMQELSGQINTK